VSEFCECLQAACTAARAAGYLCYGDGSQRTLTQLSDALMATASNKSEVLQAAVGEALCCVFSGRRVRVQAVRSIGFRV
jgi:hypothetical protein